MQTESETVTQTELADFVVERDSSVADEVSDRQGVEMELRHVHLPKLDGVGAVEYEPQEERVRIDSATLTTKLEDVRSTIEDIEEARTER